VSALTAVAHNAVIATSTLVAAPPNPGLGNAPPEVQNRVNAILSLIAWLGVAACVAGVLIVGMRMALLHRRGELGEHMGGLGAVLGGCAIIGTASALVGFFI